MDCDLLLKGGRLIDPAAGIDAEMDVAIAGGRVAAVDRDIPAATARDVRDVAGRVVVPGFVDLHAHVFPGVTWLGIDGESHYLAHGVTTVLDAGSAGASNVAGLRRFVLQASRLRIFAAEQKFLIGIRLLSGSIDASRARLRCVVTSNGRIDSIRSPNNSTRTGLNQSGAKMSTRPPRTENSPGSSTAVVR